jgi:hypothetical protein
MAALTQKHGAQEVAIILNAIQQRGANQELIGEECQNYRIYRQTFARFGGQRRFLDKEEYEELVFEHGQRLATRQFKSPIRRPPSRRERELYDLTLVGVHSWEDITPPAIPPQPTDFDAPLPGTYTLPVQELLTWGWDLDEERIVRAAGNKAKWQPAIPDLLRAIFDEGLLSGWPAKDASWAPYHALHLLGHLQAHKHAGRLLALMDRENDWLSDRLPVVWGLMGSQAAPPLWTYLENRAHDPDKRAIVLNGLAAIAQAQPKNRPDIVTALIDWLQEAPAADATVNGYLVFILNRMKAIEAREAITTAFEQDRVDTRIMQWHDVTMFQDRIDLTRHSG